jgi:hypothetical protein
MSAFFFVLRRLLAWAGLIVFALVLWGIFAGEAPPWPFGAATIVVLVTVLVTSVSHVNRVRLNAHDADMPSLSNRHRRRIEIPFAAGEAFDTVDAAIRELPYVDHVEGARDSLQVHARVKRMDPYTSGKHGRREARGARGARRNLVHATVTPMGATSSVNLVCEPEAGAWLDWFMVDDGTNLENMEAITRAITRRISEARKGEEAQVRAAATEKELATAKLSLLQAQVEPHFLYNTLASAQLLTRSDAAKADEMLGHLITYLRHSVPRAEQAMSTVGEEVERTRAYLEILKIRMGERLALNVQVPDALKPVPLPPMMVQTLAENAIKHGLERLPEGGSVWVFARERDGKVTVTVADDGVGFNEDSAGSGIGLRNVRERLKLAYGNEASFSIVANFPRGVAATISVPSAGPPGALHG